MLLFIILFFVQFLAELALEIIINKLIFKNFFEISFLFKNWLVTLTYEGILYLFIFSSLYYINLFFLKLEKKYSIIYLFTILSAHGIIHYLLFRDSFFNVEFILHPTYGVSDRILLLAIIMFTILLILQRLNRNWLSLYKIKR